MANGTQTLDPKAAITPEAFYALQQELASLKRVVSNNVDAMPGEPFYECAEPFYSSDDVYYPTGARFVDVTGVMCPNENLIPLNDAARDRMAAYLNSLPNAQRTPTLANMAEAIMRVRPKHGDDPAMLSQIQARMLAEAFEIQNGVGTDPEAGTKSHAMPRSRANVPMMPNTKIIGGNDVSRGTSRTRFVSDPIPPANRTTRVMGTVQSTPMGSEQLGVRGQ